LVALIFYSSPLIAIIKWPFVIVSALLGAGMAFVPLEERPLERWIFAFFRAIYSPTEFVWKKSTTPTKFFQDEPVGNTIKPSSNPQTAALDSYLAKTKKASGPLAKLEEFEDIFMARISSLFAGSKNQKQGGPQTPPSAPAVPEKKEELKIPVNIPTAIAQQGASHLVVEERPKLAPSIEASTQNVSPIIAGDEIVSTKQAIFSVDAAPPNPPNYPNVVVGQVVDQDRKIIEGAIMEIRDEAGRPVRALRSNKVGHFITVTSLDPGRYQIVTEKDGYQFHPVSFEAEGKLIPPILVEGKNLSTAKPLPTQPPQQISGQAIPQSFQKQYPN